MKEKGRINMLRYKCVVRFEKSGLANRTEQKKYREIALRTAAGVCSNPCAENILSACEKNGIAFYHPSPIFCTDNAAMIGVAGYYEYLAGTRHGWDLNAIPNLKLGER